MDPQNSIGEIFHQKNNPLDGGIDAPDLAEQLEQSRTEQSEVALKNLDEHIEHVHTAVEQGDIFLATQWLESLQANIAHDADPKHATISADQFEQYSNTYRTLAQELYVPEGEEIASLSVLEKYKRDFFENQVNTMLAGCESGKADSHICNQLEYLNKSHIVKNLSQETRQHLESTLAQLSPE